MLVVVGEDDADTVCDGGDIEMGDDMWNVLWWWWETEV